VIAEEYAPAKLTWTLRVIGSRPDGFHDVEALASAVSEPGDRLTIQPDAEISLTVHGASRDVPRGSSNLVWRAADAAGVGVAIELTKQIPAGGGLGGGSSDAAAVLRVLRRDFGLEPGRVDAIAAELGSDVPVCLAGGLAWMRGRGEIVERLAPPPPIAVLVAVPPIHTSTSAVYAAWDDLGGPKGTRPVEPPPALSSLVDVLVNDLEPAAERTEPALATFRRALAAELARPPVLAGSGSAYAAWYEDVDEARTAARAVRERLGVATFVGVAG
jgi:4-diphosphocytidyl-2-C-methyl-D-erythritol kinase